MDRGHEVEHVVFCCVVGSRYLSVRTVLSGMVVTLVKHDLDASQNRANSTYLNSVVP